VSALRAPAQAAFVEATERATALNAAAATVDFALAALELTDADDATRPHLQYRLAVAKSLLGESDFDAALAARDGFVAHGDVESAALADVHLGRMHWLHSNPAGTLEHYANAVALVEERPLSFAKARVFAQRARHASLSGEREDAIEMAQRALEMAEEIGDDELTSHVLNTLGMAHAALGDPEGIEELRRSVEFAEASSSPDAIHTALNNLANMQWLGGDLEGASASLARAREVDERFGNAGGLFWLDIEDMIDHELRGQWDEALAHADAFLERAGDSRHYLEGPVRFVRTLVFVARGELEAAQAEATLLLEHARDVQGEQIAPSLADAARVFVAAGRKAEADLLLAELFRDHRPSLGSAWLRELPLLLSELGRGDEYLAAAEGVPPSPWLDAGTAVAEGRFAEAAASYARFGARATEAWARVLAAEAFVADGRQDEADEQLDGALRFFRDARATPFVRRCEALAGASAQAASGGMGPSAST
jgi:tetratricopeptide (TPR) repeat protein